MENCRGNGQLDRLEALTSALVSVLGEYRVYSGFQRGTGRALEPHGWPLARSVTTGEEVLNEEIDFERGDGPVAPWRSVRLLSETKGVSSPQ